jgi:hypothetical protein
MVLGSVGGTLALSGARSAVVGNDVFLEGTYLSVGISGAGSFGTYNAAPAGFHPSADYGGTLGLRYDQDGFDMGNAPTTGDFFLPGTPEERFVLGYKISGEPSVFNNSETMHYDYGEPIDVIRESFSNLSSGTTLEAQWVGHTGGDNLRVTQVVQFEYDQRVFTNTVTLQNVGSTPLESVRYMRNVDPDQDYDTYGNFYTNNQITVQQTADGEARVLAVGLMSGVGLSYYSTDARARVSTFGFSNTDPYDAAAYDQAGVYDGDVFIAPKGSVIEDQAISICADLGTIQPGQQQTFVYYTGFEVVPQYAILASAGSGGTISPSGDLAVFEGSSRSFVITANKGDSIASVVVDGARVSVTSRATMSYTFSGVTANHTITASFTRPDMLAPVIELPDGVPQSAVGSPYDLHLSVTDDRSVSDVGVFENGQRVGGSLTGGDIRIRLTLPDGRHDLVIVALDGAGNRTERALTLVVDTMPPAIVLAPIPTSVSSPVLTVEGTVRDAVSGLRSFTINGESVVPFSDGSFSEKLTLTKGDNTIIMEAVDNAGHVTSQTFTVKYVVASSSAPSSLYVVLTIGSADMEVNGMTQKMDAAPFIKDGRTLLPIRALIEALHGTVQWNASTKTATVMLGSRTVALTIGSTTALVDGKAVALDVAPVIVKGHTFLPLRAVAENLGLDLAWEPVSKTISFTYWP